MLSVIYPTSGTFLIANYPFYSQKNNTRFLLNKNAGSVLSSGIF